MKNVKSVKRLLASFLAVNVLLSGFATLAYAKTEAPTELFVSVDGSENALGTREDPLSLEGAQKKVREIKANGLPENGITVNLLGGTYILDKSFTLGEEDSGEKGSPIVWQSAPGENVIISGAYDLSVEDFEAVTDENILNRLPESARSSVKVYDLTENLGLTEFAPIPKNGAGWSGKPDAAALIVDGQQQTLARYPNEGWSKITKVYDGGFVPRNETGTTEEYWIEQKGPVFGSTQLYDKYELWKQEADIWTRGYYVWEWAEDNVDIKSVEQDESTKTLKMVGGYPSFYGCDLSPGTFYAYNLLCEIDQPGEWYLDRENGKLYVYPPKEFTKDTNVSIALTRETLIKAENADFIQFKNLTFKDSNGTGIELLSSDDMLVAGCSFLNLGQLAVSVGDPLAEDKINSADATAGYRNIITSCNIEHTGQGGVYISGGNRYTLTPAGSKVQNCYFNDYAVTKRTYAPAVQANGVGIEVSNNRITNAPHVAIQFEGNDMLISNNDISNVCYETSDCGAIYTCRKWTYFGIEITNNYIHDMISNYGTGSAAVYIDDLATGIKATNNLFVNVPGRIALFGGGSYNTFSNNISINSGLLSYDARGTGWGSSSFPTCRDEKQKLMENEAFDEAKWKETYPDLFKIDTPDQAPAYPWYNDISNNLLVGTGKLDVNGNVQSHGGTVENNQVLEAEADIGFTNPDRLDFSVREGDNLIRDNLGDDFFKADQVGLYKDEYRTSIGVNLDQATLVSPENNLSDVQAYRGVNLKWEEVAGAGRYAVEIADNEEFTGDNVQTFVQNGTSVLVKGLKTGTTYYWRVTAIEDRLNGNTSVSEVYSFTTSDTYDQSYYDGFGDPSFSAWEKTGTPTRSTEFAHTGKYSYVLDESKDHLDMYFDEPQAQVVSVWLYDNMQKDPYTSAVASAYDDEYFVMLGVKFNGANTGSQDYYVYRVAGSWVPTTVPRTEGWHELKWDYSSGTDCKAYIDETLVYTYENFTGFTRFFMGDCWADPGAGNGDISRMAFDDLRIGNPVLNPQPTNIALEQDEITIKAGGKTQELTASLETDIDVPMELVWESSVGEVATVRPDEEDSTKAILSSDRVGETIITVYPKGFPEMKSTCKVTVIEDEETKTYELVVSGGTGNGLYKQGEEVTVTANPAEEGSRFAGWTAEGLELTEEQKKAETLTFVMPANKVSLTATYEIIPEEVDKSLLQDAYEYASNLNTDGVAEDAVAYFEKVLKEAKAVLDNVNATQEEVDNAWNNLLEGVWGLGIVQGDKRNLEKLIAKAESMVENQGKYVATHWQELLDALKEAKDVMDNGNALEEDVKAAAEALHQAILDQRYKANKDNLEELINKANEIDLSQYTAASVAVFKASLKAANEIMADESLSQDDQAVVDRAVKDLSKAIENLQKDSDSSGESEESGNESEGSDNSDNGSGNESQGSDNSEAANSPTTGDTRVYLEFVSLAIVSLVMLGVLYWKKKKIA